MGHMNAPELIDEPALATLGSVVGCFHGLSGNRMPLVSMDGDLSSAVEARTICDDFWSGPGVAVGAPLLLQFDTARRQRPVVVGVLREPPAAPKPHAVLDGEVVRLQAGKTLELVCGRASIVLTADGKIVIKGANLVSRSSGPNKIRGATVAIN